METAMDNGKNAPVKAHLRVEGAELLGSRPTFRDEALEDAETRAVRWKVISLILFGIIVLIFVQSHFPQTHIVLPWGD